MADLWRVMVSFGVFSCMQAELRAAGVAEALRGPARRTLLVVPDDAFCLPHDEPLERFLRRHVLVHAWDTVGLATTPWVETLDGERLNISLGTRPAVGGVRIIQGDVRADNGFLHVLDAPLGRG